MLRVTYFILQIKKQNSDALVHHYKSLILLIYKSNRIFIIDFITKKKEEWEALLFFEK